LYQGRLAGTVKVFASFFYVDDRILMIEAIDSKKKD
jgi:hypothetical protein